VRGNVQEPVARRLPAKRGLGGLVAPQQPHLALLEGQLEGIAHGQDLASGAVQAGKLQPLVPFRRQVGGGLFRLFGRLAHGVVVDVA
jgi:hypothetical protein